ncbi:MAG: hypothetical protein JWR05_2785 [Mucilaginibacter sp.]|nr:hypothetical protein [Mucilaginibacter sp.]
MKRIIPILLFAIILSVYSCQKDQSVKMKATNGALSTKSSLKILKDTTPPPTTFILLRDTTPPPTISVK